MKYIKLFNTHNDYETYMNSQDKALPNVSYCEDNDELHYNVQNLAEEYFTTIALENGTISFNIYSSIDTDCIVSIDYSVDNGNTWVTTLNEDNKEENLVINVNVNAGDKILWRGIATQMGYYDEDDYDDYVGSFFSSTCEFDAKGNVMSLLYGDNFKGQTTINENGAFCYLFCDYDEEKTCSIVNAKDLSLPATTLATGCYSNMFSGCTSLTTAPTLPATTLATGCYNSMFSGCTSLTTAPSLPATTLVDYCYGYMFKDCTSLTTAPSLPATTLADYCYNYMFQGCTSLNYIKAMFTTTPSSSYTGYWVNNVASTGTFVKNSSASWNVTGVHGVPSGWTVQTSGTFVS